MLYRIENEALHLSHETELAPHTEYIGFFTPEEAAGKAAALQLEPELLSFKCGGAITFDARENVDALCLKSFHSQYQTGPFFTAAVLLRRGLLLFYSPNAQEIEKAMLDSLPERNLSLPRLLFAFLELLTAKHMRLHENIETEITELENALLANKKRNCVKEIITLRRSLMALKRYYEQMLNALDMLEQNENELIDEKSMRYFRLYANRIDRLYHGVLNLRDYVTQVRESYQAEVDISLNNVMKIFTVITAIFLPLSLIAGWYGMNLDMPEYRWPYSYIMVIVLSVAVVIFSIGFFKKKKWF